MALIGWGLHRENKRRDALPETEEEESYIDEVQADGTIISKKLDMAFADLTDRQNLSESFSSRCDAFPFLSREQTTIDRVLSSSSSPSLQSSDTVSRSIRLLSFWV